VDKHAVAGARRPGGSYRRHQRITGYPRERGAYFPEEGLMAGSVNKVILIGNLGRDPEIRRTQDGRPIANLRIATSESWRDKTTGERRDKTEWHTVVIFSEGLCRIAEQYLKKGAKVYIEGQLQTRKWQAQDGQDRYTTEVVLQGFNSVLTMLDSRGGGVSAGSLQDDDPASPGSGGPSSNGTAKRGASAEAKGGFDNTLNDDIPF
jgi:single-strand DNA-binding protein